MTYCTGSSFDVQRHHSINIYTVHTVYNVLHIRMYIYYTYRMYVYKNLRTYIKYIIMYVVHLTSLQGLLQSAMTDNISLCAYILCTSLDGSQVGSE